MYIRVLFYLILVFILTVSCGDEEDLLPKEEMKEEIVAVESSTIPNHHFYSIDFDKDNNLWMHTIVIDTTVNVPGYSSYLPMKSLLIKYDGDKYTTYEGLLLSDFFISSDNTLWLYNYTQLMTFNKKDKVSLQFETVNEEQGIERVFIGLDDKIWIEGYNDLGVYKKVAGIWEKQYSPSKFRLFHVDRNGDTYFTNNNPVVLKYGNSEAQVIGQKEREDIFQYYISSVYTDSANNVWAGLTTINTTDNLLAVFNGDWNIQNPIAKTDMPDKCDVDFMFNDKVGRLWVVFNDYSNYSSKTKSICYVWDGNKWSLLKGIDKDDKIWNYAFDKNNNLWFSTYKKGIFKVDF